MPSITQKEYGHIHRQCLRTFKKDFTITSKGNVEHNARLYSYSFATGRFYDITEGRAA